MRSSTAIVESIKHRVPAGLRPLARRGYHRVVVPLQCRAVEVADRVQHRTYDGRVLPPARLRHKVRGTPSGEEFARVGRVVAGGIERGLRRYDLELASFGSILDFGSGPAGTILWLRELVPDAVFSGTDIDAEAIAWAQANVPDATFGVNGALPPLAYADAAFDLVYAISVFTHLDEAHQDAWLDELFRVTRPGGICMVTVHAPSSWPDMPADARAELERDGFVFVRTDSWEGLFPEWYQSTFHTRAYVEGRFTRRFELVGFWPPEMDAYQSYVLLRKPEAAAVS